MGKKRKFWRINARLTLLVLLGAAGLAALLLYKLGSLVGGLSANEIKTAQAPLGWHGIYHDPLNLPIDLVRSVVYWLSSDHGQTLTRLPNTLFGALAVMSFGGLIWLWHGTRTAILTTLLFATSAWVLHVSRMASFDVLYLWGITCLLLGHVLLYRYGENMLVWYGNLVLWGLLMYVPGMVWLVMLEIYLQRSILWKAWKDLVTWRRRFLTTAYTLTGLSLLIFDFTRSGHLARWLGMPDKWTGLTSLIKNMFAVPVHLFLRGPQYPDLWLAKAPLLDVFSLLACGLGIYFYAKHWKASRSRLLGSMALVGGLLVGLNGPVSLSLLVPLLYVAAAAGIAYLLHEWLKVFPSNPFARGLGIGLVAVVVSLSCLYNLRAYFIAWPHNTITKQTFIYNR